MENEIDLKDDKKFFDRIKDSFYTKEIEKSISRQDFLTEEYWDRYQEWLYPTEQTEIYETKF